MNRNSISTHARGQNGAAFSTSHKSKSSQSRRVLLAFFITMLTCLALFGGWMLFLSQDFSSSFFSALSGDTQGPGAGENPAASLSSENGLDSSYQYTADESQNQTMLMILDCGRGDAGNLFLVGRFVATEQEFILLPLSGKTACQINTQRKSLYDFYRTGGSLLAAEAVKNAINLPVTRYLQTTPAGFNTIVERLGGVNYPVPFDIQYEDPQTGEKYNLSAGRQLLDGVRLRQLFTYPEYPGGEDYRTKLLGAVMAELLNQHTAASLSANPAMTLDPYFRILVNNSDTNFSRKDYEYRRRAAAQCFTSGAKPFHFEIPQGEWGEDGLFQLSVAFRNRLSEVFQEEPLVSLG